MEPTEAVVRLAEAEAPPGEGRNEGSHGAHRYSFRLYALDGELAVGSDLGRRDLERAMKGCVLEVAEPVGTCRR